MPRRSNRDKHIRHTSRQCHGFTRSDVMIVLVTILVGLMASIPIVASAKRQNAQTTSAANLMRINQGLINYAADWNDRPSATDARKHPFWKAQLAPKPVE